MAETKILVTGAKGQLGSVLTQALRARYGQAQVVATDIRETGDEEGPFEILDITDKARLYALQAQYGITQVYHLAAILSATGEQNPALTWKVNMDGLLNVLELGRERGLSRIYFPSSIAVFGTRTPRQNTPQYTVLNPSTVYGISKRAGEQWCAYYRERYGVDVRSLRYPGLIGYESLPGGGTTDYAVDIYHKAIAGEAFSCFLEADTALPMMYMPDAIRATIEVMEAPAEAITVNESYNLSGMSFTPAEITRAIQAHYPDFEVSYAPDFRQQIAASWTESVDDSAARKDWGWQEAFDLEKMTADMLQQLKNQKSISA